MTVYHQSPSQSPYSLSSLKRLLTDLGPTLQRSRPKAQRWQSCFQAVEVSSSLPGAEPRATRNHTMQLQ